MIGLPKENIMIEAQVLSYTYDLVDLLNSSDAMKNYLARKKELAEDEHAQATIRAFNRLKVRYDEVERFGKYHPDYHCIHEQLYDLKRLLNQIPAVKRFKEAEEKLDEILYMISQTIAHSVSFGIKIPSNHPYFNSTLSCGTSSGGGCGTGCGTGGNCGCH
jgi:cell fate (sporulation/competence/biofilm development) regulator YlbF (YheA/YmcA/DUF963 family)